MMAGMEDNAQAASSLKFETACLTAGVTLYYLVCYIMEAGL